MLLEIAKMPEDTATMNIWHWSKIKNLKSARVVINNAEDLKRVERTAWKMIKTCLQADGIGLAAPQVGIFEQIVIIREIEVKEEDGKSKLVPLPAFKVFINPNWTFVGEQKILSNEACLSVPGVSFQVERYKKIISKWEDHIEDTENKGFIKKIAQERPFQDDFSVIFQHETDHLRGVSIP